VTGTRADFGKLLPVAEVFQQGNLESHWYVTGMHLLSDLGFTCNEVYKSVPNHDLIHVSCGHSDLGAGYEEIIAGELLSMTRYLRAHRYDAVVIHGDRAEALAATMACRFTDTKAIHIEGGEISGTMDDFFRKCCSVFANFHLCSSDSARDAITALTSEAVENVAVVGSPELDVHLRQENTIDDVKKHYEIKMDNYGILIFHPDVIHPSENLPLLRLVMEAVDLSELSFVAIKPNNDPGCEELIAELNGWQNPNVVLLPSMRFSAFSTLLRHSQLFIGNSSVAVREAPFMGIPSINLGLRQRNRGTAKSIVNIPRHDCMTPEDIAKLIVDIQSKRYEPNFDFGDGSCSAKIKKLLDSDWFKLGVF